MGDELINIFNRNPDIEMEIDLKTALQFGRFESLSLFLNTLTNLISKYNVSNGLYEKRRLCDFLKNRGFGLEKNDIFYLYSREEIDYIEVFRVYMADLRNQFLGASYQAHEVIQYFLNSIKILVLQSVEGHCILKCIKDEACKFDGLGFNIVELDENYFLYINKYNYCVCLIRNAISFEMVDRRFLAALIVDGNFSGVVGKIEKSTNIDIVLYRENSEDFTEIKMGTSLEWCSVLISKILRKATDDYANNIYGRKDDYYKIIKLLNMIDDNVKSINSPFDLRIGRMNFFELNDIKQLRDHVKSVSHQIQNFHLSHNFRLFCLDLNSIASVLSATYNKVFNILELDGNINISLSEIKRNNTLYIVSGADKRGLDFAFGEENLTSILASNLRCIYKSQKNISIVCEAMVGNGRSDINLMYNGDTFGIIESKLIKENTDICLSVIGAIDQLYSRYGENLNIKGDSNLKLYLVIYAYDKNISHIEHSIFLAIKSYSERNSLEYEEIHRTENGVKFSYRDAKKVFGAKYRVINVLVCNMEIDYKKRKAQRTAKKMYDPSIRGV